MGLTGRRPVERRRCPDVIREGRRTAQTGARSIKTMLAASRAEHDLVVRPAMPAPTSSRSAGGRPLLLVMRMTRPSTGGSVVLAISS